jgi:hypothetical protein
MQLCWNGSSAVTESKLSVSLFEVLGDVLMKCNLWSLQTGSSVLGKTVLISTITFLSGCGESGLSPSGKVSGIVTFLGKPITEGEVHFYSPKLGVGAKIPLDSSGHFVLSAPIEVGDYSVAVTPPPLPDPSVGTPPPPKLEHASIPSKYRNNSLSGLVASIKVGDNKLSFDLKP